MNTFTFKIGFRVNDIITAVHCPLEGFVVSVDKTSEIKEVNERKPLMIFVEDYLCSTKVYAISSVFVCSVSDLLNLLTPLDGEKDEARYLRVSKEFSSLIPYIDDNDEPVTVASAFEECDLDE